MTDFKITFNHPWLLLLFIPALLLTLIPYFRLHKKYRFTRNRILSMTLHITASLLAVLLLAGLGFSYSLPNEKNQLIILVDRSDSTEEGEDYRDGYVKSIIDLCPEGCSIGIVSYGYGCEVAAELTSDREGLYEKYLQARLPDGSATALADALRFSADMLTSPESGKIVLISDGLETDGNAESAISDILSRGIRVDTLTLPVSDGGDVQILSADIRDSEIRVGESFTVDLGILAGELPKEEAVMLRLYDNGKPLGESAVGISSGFSEIPVSVSVGEWGIHELTFEIITDHELFGDPLADRVKENNKYRTYINLEELENILLIERYEGEGETLRGILSETKRVTDISVESDLALFPGSLKELAEYEQVVLVNIAYADMPEGFEEMLNAYVYELGGGLFTVGGRNDIGQGGALIPHAYNREDLDNSTYYKQMLPVSAEDYTPPLAVMLVVDTSLSMKSTGKLSAAIDGARACLDALHDRDFCGVVSFSTASSERLSVLPVSQRETISEAIKKVSEDAGGGTIFSDAIMKAGRALSVINNVERKHIILITDGLPGDSFDDYKGYIENNVEDGITMSVLTLGIDDAKKEAEMQRTATAGGGKFYNVKETGSIAGMMYKDLTEEAIPEIDYGREFIPTVKDKSSITAGLDAGSIPPLTGYYGTVAKKSATVALMGEYVPIYASHKYGRGRVGSFMCDLSGEWSAEFVGDLVGRAIIANIAESLFPYEDLRADGIRYELREDNYTHWINIHGAAEGESISVSVTPISTHLQHLNGSIAVSAAESSRFTFTLTEGGLYLVNITVTADGGESYSIPVYKAVSYSKEYDRSISADEGRELMAALAQRGGAEISDPVDAYSGFKDRLEYSYDPRVILIIAAIVLMLVDIAARKFKFKWLHELWRERKNETK